jgi:hypothetical protein
MQFHFWPGATTEQVADTITAILEHADEAGLAEKTRQHLQGLLNQLEANHESRTDGARQ